MYINTYKLYIILNHVKYKYLLMNSKYVGPLNYCTNAYQVSTNLHLNSQTIAICKMLFKNGLINSYEITKYNKRIKVFCSYMSNKQAFTRLEVISKPGRKVYMSYHKLKKLWKSRFNRNVFILSTNRGYLTSEEAIRNKIGGEILIMLN